MFEAALKGTKGSKRTKSSKGAKVKRWKTFGAKDANRWKKEGSALSMMKLTRKAK